MGPVSVCPQGGIRTRRACQFLADGTGTVHGNDFNEFLAPEQNRSRDRAAPDLNPIDCGQPITNLGSLRFICCFTPRKVAGFCILK